MIRLRLIITTLSAWWNLFYLVKYIAGVLCKLAVSVETDCISTNEYWKII